MTALTKERDTQAREGVDFVYTLAAGAVGFAGGIGCVSTSTGLANRGSTSTTLKAVGRIKKSFNQANGDTVMEVEAGVFGFNNSSSTDQITNASVGLPCYIVDDNTVALTNGTNTRSVAGRIVDVSDGQVWVRMGPQVN